MENDVNREAIKNDIKKTKFQLNKNSQDQIQNQPPGQKENFFDDPGAADKLAKKPESKEDCEEAE